MNADAYKKIMTLSRIACFIALQCALPAGNTAFAREYFNPALLGIDGPGKELTDLSAFEEGIGQMPGTYRVDVIVNKSSAGVHDVNFVMQKDTAGNTTLQPCFSVDSLREFGIRTDAFPNLAGHGDCANLAAIPQASAEFAFERQQLRLSIPQAAVDSHARGYVAPERLDEGINALLLNYSFSGANTEARRGDMTDSDSYYLSLRPGLNIGPWRIRNYSTWNRNVNGDSADESWDSLYTYAQRNIIALKSQLTFGESTAPSELFDSVPFRGAQLASDDDMLPDSLRGYAPVVRGIARTNAQVIIKQNGYTIYQSYVSPGAFEITDMYPTGSSGDLDVTIKEADGSEQHQTVAFASLPILQREGRLKYSVTSGQYRPYESDIDKKMFTQATLIYGLPAGFTVYGGASSHSTTSPCSPGLEKTSASWAPSRWMALRHGQRKKIRIKRAASPGASVTVKIFSKPAPIYPFPVIGIQHQVITLSRKYWIPGVTTSRKIITTAAATVLNFSLTRVSVRVWGHCRSMLLAKITGTVTGRCALSVWVTVIAGAA